MNSYFNDSKYKSLNISYPLRSFVGKYPWLFYALYGLIPKNRKMSVHRDTQLVIEGFPRSANTFAVVAVQNAQPVKLRLAHHMHVPAQVIRGVHWNIPTIVLIRKPKDAIVSFIIHDKNTSITEALNCYISFYQKIYPYKAHYVVGLFEEVINNLSGIIQKTNNKFRTSFVLPVYADSSPIDLFQRIESIAKVESIRRGETGYSELEISRPSSARKPVKKELMGELSQSQYSELIKIAEKTYNDFLSQS